MNAFTIASEADVDELERLVRLHLQCDGSQCTFLESAPYRHMRMQVPNSFFKSCPDVPPCLVISCYGALRKQVLRRLRGGEGWEEELRVFPHSTFMISVTDSLRVEFTSRVPPLEPVCGLVGRPRNERAWDEYDFSRHAKRPRVV